MTDANHEANRVSPDYIEAARARELSVALSIGSDAFKFDGGWDPHRCQFSFGGKMKWVQKSPLEVEAINQGDMATLLAFQYRVRTFVTGNTYIDSLKTSAAQPLDRKPVLDGWPDQVAAYASGKNGGLDGNSSDLLDMMAECFERKLIAGTHYLEGYGQGARLLWKHLNANDLIYWEIAQTEEGPQLVAAVSQAYVNGRIIRTVYELTDTGVAWRQYLAAEVRTIDRAIYAPKTVEELHLTFGAVFNSGVIRGLDRVPIVEFAANRERRPPCRDAAELQLDHDIKVSEYSALTRDVSDMQGQVFTNMGTSKETGQTRTKPARAGRQHAYPKDGEVKDASVKTDHPSELRERIREIEAAIRRKCFDGGRQYGENSTDVKATEVLYAERRANHHLERMFKRDRVAALQLLQLTAAGSNWQLTGEESVNFTPNKTQAARTSELEQVARWEKDAVLPAGTFRDAFELMADYPPELVERMRAKADAGLTEPQKPATV